MHTRPYSNLKTLLAMTALTAVDNRKLSTFLYRRQTVLSPITCNKNPARRSCGQAYKYDTPSGIFKLCLTCVPLNERLQHLATEPGRLLLPLAAVLLTAVPMPVHTKGTVHSAACNAAHVGTDCPLLSPLLCKDVDGCAIAALALQQ